MAKSKAEKALEGLAPSLIRDMAPLASRRDKNEALRWANNRPGYELTLLNSYRLVAVRQTGAQQVATGLTDLFWPAVDAAAKFVEAEKKAKGGK